MDRARSFGTVAATYAAARPTYPVEAVQWALFDAKAPKRVVDLGAGTGKLTSIVAGLGHDVLAVDPDEAMLATLSVRGAQAIVGSAEDIPLPDHAADAVIGGQSYHWFDHARSTPEIARVLKPKGTVAWLWNERDERVAWVADLGRIMRSEDAGAQVFDEPGHFSHFERLDFPHEQRMDVESLVALAASRSYVIMATPEQRVATLDGVRELAATHPDLKGRTEFDLPYRTAVFRAKLRN